MGARDSSEAAKLLWKAVRQQNTTAAVLLSGLYARGDGVPKNCDQARLLLVAAAKRGAAQAAEQLRTWNPAAANKICNPYRVKTRTPPGWRGLSFWRVFRFGPFSARAVFLIELYSVIPRSDSLPLK